MPSQNGFVLKNYRPFIYIFNIPCLFYDTGMDAGGGGGAIIQEGFDPNILPPFWPDYMSSHSSHNCNSEPVLQ